MRIPYEAISNGGNISGRPLESYITRIFLGGDRAATEARLQIASIGLYRKVGGSGTIAPSCREQMQICLHHRLCGRHEVVVGGRSTRDAVCRSPFRSWQCFSVCRKLANPWHKFFEYFE